MIHRNVPDTVAPMVPTAVRMAALAGKPQLFEVQLGRTMQPRRAADTHGSTDMGNVTTVIPGIHPFLSITDGPVPGHSIAFTEAARSPRALETMHLAAKALAMTALDVLSEPGLLKRAKEAHTGRAA